MMQPQRDFVFYHCIRCHCVAFRISITSERLKYDGALYVCPHLRHGRWEREGKLHHPGPASAADLVHLAMNRDSGGPVAMEKVPHGCHTECEYEHLRGYNPDHSINRTDKIRNLWPGYGEHQMWNDKDCILVLAHQSDITVEFR